MIGHTRQRLQAPSHRRQAGLIALACAVLLLAGCRSQEEEDIQVAGDLALPAQAHVIEVVGGTASLPSATRRTAWTQAAGSADHTLGHSSFDGVPTSLWVQDVSTPMDRGRLASMEPLIYAGRAFVITWDRQVLALNLNTGAIEWRQDLGETSRNVEDQDDTSNFGGGLALMQDRLFAATGTGMLHALDLDDGSIAWSLPLSGPVRGGPLAYAQSLYLIDVFGTLSAVSTSGTLQWTVPAPEGLTTLLAPSTPTGANHGIFAMQPNGVLTAFTPNGELSWRFDLGLNAGTGRLADRIGDARALTLVDDSFLLASSWSGRTVALTANKGQVLWDIPIGGAATPALTADYVFLVTKDGVLRALERDTGLQIWSRDLSQSLPQQRRQPVGWFGPLMAGGRLILASTSGVLTFVDPATGAQDFSLHLGSPIATPLSLASDTLLVTTQDGKIHAFK